MTTYTARGAYPSPDLDEPPHGPDQLAALAERVAATVNAPAMTALERDALSGDDLYGGRTILNTDAGQMEIWDGAAWLRLALDGHVHGRLPENLYALGANHTLTVDDVAHVAALQPDGGTVQLTIPTAADSGIEVASVVEAYQYGAGTLDVVPASGVTLRSPVGVTGARALAGDQAAASLRQRATDEWVLQGRLA